MLSCYLLECNYSDLASELSTRSQSESSPILLLVLWAVMALGSLLSLSTTTMGAWPLGVLKFYTDWYYWAELPFITF